MAVLVKAAAVLPRNGADVIFYIRVRTVVPRLAGGSTASDFCTSFGSAEVGTDVIYFIRALPRPRLSCRAVVPQVGAVVPRMR